MFLFVCMFFFFAEGVDALRGPGFALTNINKIGVRHCPPYTEVAVRSSSIVEPRDDGIKRRTAPQQASNAASFYLTTGQLIDSHKKCERNKTKTKEQVTQSGHA